MGNAFICWRPYQVFNAINIVKNNVENSSCNSDLYIQDIDLMLSLKDNIEALNLFSNIYIFHEENRGDGVGISNADMMRIYVKRAYNFITPKKAIKKACVGFNDEFFLKRYDKIFCSGWISF